MGTKLVTDGALVVEIAESIEENLDIAAKASVMLSRGDADPAITIEVDERGIPEEVIAFLADTFNLRPSKQPSFTKRMSGGYGVKFCLVRL